MFLLIDAIKVVVIASVVLTMVPVLIWWERKGAAYIQDRRGPNRAHIFGVRMGGFIHNLADVAKLLFKEDIIPKRAHKVLYIIAPMIVMGVAISTVAVIPFSSPIKIGDMVFKFQIADLNVGVFYILAVASLGVYGVLLAGWASSSTYSLLGGLRASAQMISYELPMGLSLMGVLLYAGTARLDEMVAIQGAFPWDWNIVRQPLAFIIFLTCLFAETNRNPFDLPEGESEIVAGYHTEYSSMKFALFFMAEYAHIVVGSMILTSLFLGGWQVPFLPTDILKTQMPQLLRIALPLVGSAAIMGGARLIRQAKKFGWGDLRDYEPAIFGIPMILAGAILVCATVPAYLWTLPEPVISVIVPLIQLTVFLFKVLSCCWLFIWVRWTLPRFRYDQLMSLGWKVMIPLALFNIVVTGILTWHFI